MLSPYDLYFKGGLQNAGKACFGSCSHKQGACEFCGTGLCCRKGWSDTTNGCDGSLGIDGKGHVCVAKGKSISHSQAYLFAWIYNIWLLSIQPIMFSLQIIHIVISEDCEWNAWNVNGCSKSCGGGTLVKKRTKKKNETHGGKCEGKYEEKEECCTDDCPGNNCIDNIYINYVAHK